MANLQLINPKVITEDVEDLRTPVLRREKLAHYIEQCATHFWLHDVSAEMAFHWQSSHLAPLTQPASQHGLKLVQSTGFDFRRDLKVYRKVNLLLGYRFAASTY